MSCFHMSPLAEECLSDSIDNGTRVRKYRPDEFCRGLKYKVAGGSPAASHFLLSRQEKVTKEKATQVRRPFGLPCGTRPDRRLRNSPLRGSDSARGAFIVLSPRAPTGPFRSAFLGGRTWGLTATSPSSQPFSRREKG